MKNKLLIILFVALSTPFFAQVKEVEKDSITQLGEVLLTATRAKDKSPFAHTNLKKEEIESKNLGQDLPILLDQMPSVVTTSDAGAGVGYTGIRVRGSDATRVNVTLNGIPFNDSESQGTYWVDLPDFSSSVEDIQLQRGVGTSTNGAAAFGASLSLKTLEPTEKGYAETSHTFGSFNTRKHNISIGSGMKNGFYAEGRLSKINSDGYIDRASSDLSSHYVETGYKNKNTSLKLITFGGHEITYQSWYGTPEAVINGDKEGIEAFITRNWSSDAEAENLRTSGRTYNHYLYDNQIDNYTQNHYQIHLSHIFSPNLSANISGNFTHGKGYYEQYKDDEEIQDYFAVSDADNADGDVIRRKWLDNDFAAMVFSLNYKKDKVNASFGGGYNTYVGDHFGEIIWDSFPSELEIRSEYYKNTGTKTDFNLYSKGTYSVNNSFSVFADAQVRMITYKATGNTNDLVNVDISNAYMFFNPKAGANYKLDNSNSIYASFAVANREPNRDDLVHNLGVTEPAHEQLFDWEAGYRLRNSNFIATANLYFMDYKDQLVLTGALDEVGNSIRQNVANSYRAGLELQGSYKFSKLFRIDAHASFSQNKIKEYKHIVYDTRYDPDTYAWVSTTPITTTYSDTDISFSPNLVAGSVLTYTPLEGASIGISSKYVGEQFIDNTSDDDKTIKSYVVNNLNLSYTLQPTWVESISVNLLVNNLFDEEYVSNGYTYSYFYRAYENVPVITEEFYYPQAGTNFLLGVTLKM